MNVYENAWASVLKFSNDFAARMKLQGHSADLEVFDFDAFGGVDELPEKDLVGPAEFQFETSGGLFTITMMIGVSTNNDKNGFRVNKLAAELFNALLPNRLFPYVDASTGAPVGKMKVKDGTAVLAMARDSKSRPLKFVAVTVATDRAVPGPA